MPVGSGGLQERGLALGASVPLDEIHEGGAYVCNWSGHLLRVSGDSLDCGPGLPVKVIGCEPLLATKISENPYVSISRARALACEFSLPANF